MTRSMTQWILIALLVPAVALAGPKKGKGARKKKAAPVEETEKDDDATTESATPPPPPSATTITGTGSGSGAGSSPTTVPGSGPLSGQTAPTGSTGTPGKQGPTTPTGAGSPTNGTPGSTPGATGQPSTSGTANADAGDAGDKSGPDVDTLRQEYLALRDELFKSRARANAVASQLYSTRMQIRFTWGSARYYGVSKASIRLDGATVYEDATGAIATDDGVRFDGYVAPGRHLVTFHIQATGKDDDSFTSVTESQIVVKAVANKDLVVAAKGKDNGDIAYEWKRSEKGSYGLGIDVSVKSVAQGGGKGKK
jgi:hypothetical protein